MDQKYASPIEACKELGYIEHHGVKGMHWGVKKARSVAESTGRRVSTKTAEIKTTHNYNETHKAKVNVESSRALRIAGNVASNGARAAGLSSGHPIAGIAAGHAINYAVARQQHLARLDRIKKADVNDLLPNRNANYRSVQVKKDLSNGFTTKDLIRVNRNMDNGMTYRQAKLETSRHKLKVSVAKFGAKVTASMVVGAYGPTAYSSITGGIHNKAEVNRQAARSASRLAETRGLPAALKVTKPNRAGTYNLTTMR